MSIRFRRLLFIIFIFAFLIIASFATLYAAGYKINFSWPLNLKQTFQKTGMFIFNSEPKGAIIKLNDKTQQLFLKKYYSKDNSYIKTPAKIKNLLPGEYNVKLELAGFWPWQKKLTISPGQSTFAEDIYLFKKDIPMQIMDSKLKKIIPSPNNEYLSLIDEEKVLLLNLANETLITLPEIATTAIAFSDINEVSWSADSEKLIISTNNQFFYYNLINNELVNLNNLTTSNIFNLKWSDDSEKIYFQENNSLEYLTLKNNKPQILIEEENIIDYLIKSNYLFYLSQFNKSIKLKVYSLKTNELIKEIDIPFSDNYKLINPKHKLINLYDEKYKLLYLIDPLSSINPLIEIITDIKITYWLDDKRLLYANDFEIWILNLNYNSKTLLTRISEKIENIFWHPSNNYVIYSTEKAINIIELDEREKRNINELIKLDFISSPYLSLKGNTLYFYAKIGNQEGLYKLAIQ
ncbi:MAG: hypothetical protein ABH830_02065 [Patescibacteria group bacterium]